MSDDGNESSWSSDSSASSSSSRSSLATTTALGLPDGHIDTASDVQDPQVSRIGGPAVFLSALETSPAFASTHCPTCGHAMELLVQLYAPLEGTVDDRVVYVWGCAKAGCQGEGGKGSIRAFSSVKRNEKFATVKERKAAKKAARAAQVAAAAAPPKASISTNPFAAPSAVSDPSAPFNPFAAPSSASDASNPFAAAANPFGSPFGGEEAAAAPALKGDVLADSVTAVSLEDKTDIVEADSDDEAVEPLDPAWSDPPCYPAQYLSTQIEYIPRPKLTKAQKAAQAAAAAAASSSTPGGTEASTLSTKTSEWDTEGYVKGSGIPGADELFDRFLARLEAEPEQVVRYDFGAAPIPYSSTSKLHALLFPPIKSNSPPAPPLSKASKAATTVSPPVSVAKRGPYDPSRVPACPRCSGPRVFEMQLVPPLLNLLRAEDIRAYSPSDVTSDEVKPVAQPAPSATGDAAEEARRAELERVLGAKAKSSGEKTGMDWGSICVFSCEKGCGGEWAEEWVGVEWED